MQAVCGQYVCDPTKKLLMIVCMGFFFCNCITQLQSCSQVALCNGMSLTPTPAQVCNMCVPGCPSVSLEILLLVVNIDNPNTFERALKLSENKEDRLHHMGE